MDVGSILVTIGLITAIFGCYCATRRVFTPKGVNPWVDLPSRSPKLHLMPGNHLDAGYCEDANHILFRLERANSTSQHRVQAPHVGISIEELEACIPWIPQDKKVFICCPDGFEAPLLKRLSRIETSRDLYLVQTMSIDVSRGSTRSKQLVSTAE
jgi:hypothetical protein